MGMGKRGASADAASAPAVVAAAVEAGDLPSSPALARAAPEGGGAVETVCGVPLESGERVLFYSQPNHRTAKLVHIIFGVVFAVIVLGIFLIVYGVLYDRWHLKFVAMTNRRILTQTG